MVDYNLWPAVPRNSIIARLCLNKHIHILISPLFFFFFWGAVIIYSHCIVKILMLTNKATRWVCAEKELDWRTLEDWFGLNFGGSANKNQPELSVPCVWVRVWLGSDAKWSCRAGSITSIGYSRGQTNGPFSSHSQGRLLHLCLHLWPSAGAERFACISRAFLSDHLLLLTPW